MDEVKVPGRECDTTCSPSMLGPLKVGSVLMYSSCVECGSMDVLGASCVVFFSLVGLVTLRLPFTLATRVSVAADRLW